MNNSFLRLCFYLYLLALIWNAFLPAEISRVTVKWIPTNCLGPCVNDIAKQLSILGGAAEYMINQNQGQADIRWKPRFPFSISFIANAFVDGWSNCSRHTCESARNNSIHFNSGNITILGDESQFVLLGPAAGRIYQYVPQESFDTHALSPELFAQFIEAQRAFVITTVEDLSFSPYKTLDSILSWNKLLSID